MSQFAVKLDERTKRRTFTWGGEPVTAAMLRAMGEEAIQAALLAVDDERVRDALAYFLMSEWSVWARPEQLFPATEHRTILALAGRGWGKTRSGAEWVRECKRQGYAYVNLIGPTLDDAVDVMVEGESGLLAICPKAERPVFVRHKRRLEWPDGSISRIFTADEPERLRGKQHQKVWADELCAWRYPEAWTQMRMGLRLRSPKGAPVITPQALVTTTPKATKLLKELIADKQTFTIRGKTSDNVENLAPDFFSDLSRQYGGTRLGRQELDAEILEDNPGALWTRDLIERLRVDAFNSVFDEKTGDVVLTKLHRNFRRIVVAIDPPGTSNANSDECGLVVVALGEDKRGYVLEDLSGVMSPSAWGKKALEAYNRWGADRIVAEVNQGGEMVENTLRTIPGGENVSYRAVRASKGKFARAEPVSALYEQGRIHHVGTFAALEDQMVDYNPQTASKSPDRMDALVWGFTDLMVETDLGVIEFYKKTLEAAKEKAVPQGLMAHEQGQPAKPEKPKPAAPAPGAGKTPARGLHSKKQTALNRIDALRRR